MKGFLSSFADVITNSGSVEGTIDLGAGADKFFGRLGAVDPKISGGNDPDFISSGRGDDVVTYFLHGTDKVEPRPSTSPNSPPCRAC